MKSILFLICLVAVGIYAETNIMFNFDGMIPPLPTCNCADVCGDGICSEGEDDLTCPNDCEIIQPACGDGSCDPGVGEDPFTCPEDCSSCGDGVCDNTESITSCATDCIACGDGICSLGETLDGCPEDCSRICGNLACEDGETFDNCPDDCPCEPVCTGNCGDDGCGGTCGTCTGANEQCIDNNCVCVGSCTGRECGDDGCGQTCGTCSGLNEDCVNGQCIDTCTPDCTGKACGDNGCGTGSCGTCPGAQDQCVNFECVCVADCTGKDCGDDGCDGSCGGCTTGFECVNSLCVPEQCEPDCNGKSCGDDGCGNICGTCTGAQDQCLNGVCTCVAECTGRNCGDDGCGNVCGTCTGAQDQCLNGVCTCVAECAGKQCGSDGCGGTCGTCAGTETCDVNFQCVPGECVPNCAGRNCGDDGCGNVCGTCTGGQDQCINGVCTCVGDCTGRNCGDDGCGNICGTCTGAQDQCLNGVCTCVAECTGRNCGDDGCGDVCGSCGVNEICDNGVCLDTSGSRAVTFTVVGINGGSVGPAAGVSVSSGGETAVTTGSGIATVTVAQEGSVTLEGSGYSTVTLVIPGSASSYRVVIPPVFPDNGGVAIALWDETIYDLDFNMFAPGNTTQYPEDAGAVNWEWIDKSLELPYSTWTEVSGTIGAEYIEINQFNVSHVYDFMLFHWSRVGGNDATGDFNNAGAQIFIFTGPQVGGVSAFFTADPPVADEEEVYAYFSPFRLVPDNDGTFELEVKSGEEPYEPAVSLQEIIDFTPLFYDCAYAYYCPYQIPL